MARGVGDPPPPPLTTEQIKAVRSLRDSNWSWSEIAKAFGLSIDRLRRQADPQYRERWNANAAEGKRRRRTGEPKQRSVSNGKEPPIPARLDWSPPDTLVGKLMGDPPLERSALAQRQKSWPRAV